MRVLAVGTVYPPHHLGGYELIWSGVMRHLRDQGHTVRILTTDYRRPDVPEHAAEDPDVHRELDWYWREHQWRSLGAKARLRLEQHNAGVFDRHLRELKPDAITWWPVGGMSLGLIERARRAGVPAVFFVLDYWFSYGRERDLWLRSWARLPGLRALGARVTGLPTRVDFARAGRWVFCSTTARENTLHAGLRIADGVVLTPGVAASFVDAPREQPPPPWRWRLLYIGRVVEPKGVATAVECLPLLPPEAELRIVGDGDAPYRALLEHTAKRLGVHNRVTFEGAQPYAHLLSVYRAADAVLFPVAWPEPWGLVPLEAMALGRPVVATGRGGSGDYLRDGENALLFAAEDPRALAAALRRLADHRELRERVRAGGFRTAARHREDDFNRRAVQEIAAVAADGLRSQDR